METDGSGGDWVRTQDRATPVDLHNWEIDLMSTASNDAGDWTLTHMLVHTLLNIRGPERAMLGKCCPASQ